MATTIHPFQVCGQYDGPVHVERHERAVRVQWAGSEYAEGRKEFRRCRTQSGTLVWPLHADSDCLRFTKWQLCQYLFGEMSIALGFGSECRPSTIGRASTTFCT